MLDDVSLTVREGEFVAIAGPNGAGKTTLLRTALGLVQPAAGSVELKRPERVWTGTRPHPPSLCAPAPCWTPSGAVSVVVGAAADI